MSNIEKFEECETFEVDYVLYWDTQRSWGKGRVMAQLIDL